MNKHHPKIIVIENKLDNQDIFLFEKGCLCNVVKETKHIIKANKNYHKP